MKRYFKYIALSAGVLLSSCNDFLDREPLDKVTPEAFFENEGDLAAYAINLYPNVGFSTIPPGSYGLSIFRYDDATDNQAAPGGSARFLPGEWRVSANGAGWDFGNTKLAKYKVMLLILSNT